MKSASEWLRDALGYECRDRALLVAALTHRSAGGAHNERLEFLGDAVLNCVIAMLVFRELGAADEGDLSRFRASLVSGEALAVIAAEVELGEQLRLGSGELKSGGFRRKSILADALEALFGALYLDGGFDAAARVIERLLFQTNGGNRTLLPKTPFPSMVKRLELFLSGLLLQGRVDAGHHSADPQPGGAPELTEGTGEDKDATGTNPRRRNLPERVVTNGDL